MIKPEDTEFMTVAEIAKVLRVSKMTVYRLVHNGELRSTKVGRSFRVPSAQVYEYMRANGFVEAVPAQV